MLFILFIALTVGTLPTTMGLLNVLTFLNMGSNSFSGTYMHDVLCALLCIVIVFADIHCICVLLCRHCSD